MTDKRDWVDLYEGTPGTPPPEYSESLPLGQSISPPTRPIFANMDCPVLTEKEVREALEEYAQTECSDLKPTLQDMKIFDIRTQKPAYRYTIEIFSESRTLTSESEPYILAEGHQPRPGPYNSRPDKWSFPVAPPTTFADASIELAFPDSSIITECIRCQAKGSKACSSCNGDGFIFGGNCRRCEQGVIRCDDCKGHKYMMHWKNLEIQWTTKKESYLMQRGPSGYLFTLKNAQGSGIAFEERCSGNQARPILFDKDPGATETAEKVFRKICSIQNKSTKIIELCQQVQVIPVFEVDFKLNKQTGNFYVIGKSRKVYFPQGNPVNSCTIL